MLFNILIQGLGEGRVSCFLGVCVCATERGDTVSILMNKFQNTYELWRARAMGLVGQHERKVSHMTM